MARCGLAAARHKTDNSSPPIQKAASARCAANYCAYQQSGEALVRKDCLKASRFGRSAGNRTTNNTPSMASAMLGVFSLAASFAVGEVVALLFSSLCHGVLAVKGYAHTCACGVRRCTLDCLRCAAPLRFRAIPPTSNRSRSCSNIPFTSTAKPIMPAP